MRSRIGPLRVLGVDLLSAAIRAHRALWSDAGPTKSVAELALCLGASEQKLRDWRHSSARAGADEAMLWVLSWYEDLDTSILKEQRQNSRWETDPEHIQIRQRVAHEIARYANTRVYVDGPNASDDEDEDEEEAEDSDAEYANDEEAGSSDEGTDSDPAAANTSKSGGGRDSGGPDYSG